MKTGRNNSNAGFSMIELVIVIALMAILISTATISVSVITGRKVTECAESIISTMENARVITLGKAQNQVECVLTHDVANKKYILITYQSGEELSRKEIEEEGMQIQVFFDGESAGYALSDITPYGVAGGVTGSPDTGLFIQFNRASGAFMEQTNQVGGVAKSYCSRIQVSNSNRTIEIQCIGKTGKITTN